MTRSARSSSIKCTAKRLCSLLRHFGSDESGLSAVEFGFVVPFLLSLWLGLVTILDTENTTTRVGKVSATVADIIAQSPVVNSNQIEAAFDAGKAMLGNARAEDLKVFVAGIEVDDQGQQTMIWVCGRNFGGGELSAATADFNLPSHLLQQEGFIVGSYAEYTHMPLYGEQFLGEHTYVYKNYFVPRVSLKTLSSGCS